MRRIFITGATGFIGGRLAEIGCQLGIDIVALVRRWSRAARLARMPVGVAHGDILDLDSLRDGMKGCDVVFHCAIDSRVGRKAHRRSSIKGTANVMQAAMELGVERVVHLSSAAVYSYRPGPDAATEKGAYRYSGDVYCDGKIEAEKIALRYYREHSLPVTVLRPTIVYGPFGYHTNHTATLIRQGRMVLVDGGTGVCNSLYVDNLVEAMLLAAEHDDAVGKVFHISDASPVSWKEFIEAHALPLGDSYLPLPEMTVQEIAAARAQIRNHQPSSLKQTLLLIRNPLVRQALRSIPIIDRSIGVVAAIARTLLPASMIQELQQRLLWEETSSFRENNSGFKAGPLPSEAEVRMFTAFENVVFSIEKARLILGYYPKISFSEGMERTAAWIKWARL